MLLPKKVKSVDEINAQLRNKDAVARLKELQFQYGDRLQPNYSGLTGLQRWDSRGWSDMMNAQTESTNLQRQLEGDEPLQVEHDFRPVLSTGQYDLMSQGLPLQPSTAGPGQLGIDQPEQDFTKTNQAGYGRGVGSGIQGKKPLSAALRGLNYSLR